MPRTISSVGRASPLQGEGHWFEPSIVHQFLFQELKLGYPPEDD